MKKQNILCLIDTLNSGGAQRQFVNIVSGLAKSEIKVKVLVFHKILAFKPYLDSNGISVKFSNSNFKLIKIFFFIKEILLTKPTTVLSFMDGPNIVSSFFKIIRPDIKVIVSERKGFIGIPSLKLKFRFFLYRWVDNIVCNSYNASEYIANYFPEISNKTVVIYNIVDKNKFYNKNLRKFNNNALISVVANYRKEKNINALIDAIIILKKNRSDFKVQWYGNVFFNNGKPTSQSTEYLYAKERILRENISDYFQLFESAEFPEYIYNNSDAVILTSSFEGFPNVISEAMMCGSIILSSDVSDIKRIIHQCKTGYVFDVNNVNDIVESIKWFLELNSEQKNFASKMNIEIANQKFDEKQVVKKIKELI
jgi:glycosyltransferase involved in cell wall biosynthesis